jgi:hypothetical protein
MMDTMEERLISGKKHEEKSPVNSINQLILSGIIQVHGCDSFRNGYGYIAF